MIAIKNSTIRVRNPGIVRLHSCLEGGAYYKLTLVEGRDSVEMISDGWPKSLVPAHRPLEHDRVIGTSHSSNVSRKWTVL